MFVNFNYTILFSLQYKRHIINMVDLQSRTSSSVSYDMQVHDGFGIDDSFEFYPRKVSIEKPEKSKSDHDRRDIHKKETSDDVKLNDSQESFE